jgi:hypothetical protein
MLHKRPRPIKNAATQNKNMKTKLPLLTGTSLVALIFGAPLGVLGKGKQSAAPAATVTASSAANIGTKKPRTIAYHGKVTSVDPANKSFMVGTRTFKVSSNTTITKDGAAANLSDLTAGTPVSGSYWKNEDGSLEVKSVKIGGMTKNASPAPKNGAQGKE